MRKVALITGITGQDGSFLAEFLLEKGYDVHGTIRRSSVDFRERIAHLEGHPAFPSSLCGSRGFHESLAGGEEGKAYGDL